MTTDTFDTITRSAGADRRRALLALGAAGLATTLAGTMGASGKQSAGKKARKKCKKQQASCTSQVTTFCAQVKIQEECEAAFLPCCDVCDISVAVTCTLDAFLLLESV